MNEIFKQNGFAKRASALFCATLIVFLSLAGSSPALHKLVHSDADAADHHCAITLFAKGHVAAADAAPILAMVAVLFGGVALLADSFVFASADYRFSTSRAPPLR